MREFRNVLSMLLAIALSVCIYPISSQAEYESGEFIDEYTEETSSEEDLLVKGEIETERSESIKHFRMSDGSYAAVQYSVPVHYQDQNGEWKKIDNTLTEQDERYISLNGDTSRSFSSTPGNGNLFQIAYKDFSVGMTYVVPVYKKADSEIQEELITEPEETEGLTEEEYFSFEDKKYTL